MRGVRRRSAEEMALLGGLVVEENHFGPNRKPHGSAGGLRVCGADWSRLDLDNFSVWDCVFEGCDFSDSQVKVFHMGGGMVFSEYRGCDFSGLRGANLASGRGRFVGCSFRGARLRGFNARSMSMVDCDFTEAVVRSCVFWGAPLVMDLERDPSLPVANEFRGNDFSGADLVSCSFRRGVDLDAQKLPEADYYARVRHAPAALERGRELVASWDGLGDQESGQNVLNAIARDIEVDQLDQFIDVRRCKFTDPDRWQQLKQVLEQA